jgi:hypothetical protein
MSEAYMTPACVALDARSWSAKKHVMKAALAFLIGFLPKRGNKANTPTQRCPLDHSITMESKSQAQSADRKNGIPRSVSSGRVLVRNDGQGLAGDSAAQVHGTPAIKFAAFEGVVA